jgi:rhamnosyltransferase
MNTKLALGFILYKPTNNTIDRILKHSNDCYKIFIYDNDEINNTQKFIHQNIHYYSNFRNEGLSVGLNYLCAIAKKNGFTSLLYFDQDTIFNEETLNFISIYLNFLNSNISTLNNIACTTFRDFPTNYRNSNTISKFEINKYSIYNVYYTINSGSLYMLNKFDHFKWFDLNFFVDGVDYAFCINCKKNKYLVTEIYNVPGLNHDDEQGNNSVNILGITFRGRSYNYKRNIDFISSHIKLIKKSFSLYSPKASLLLIKSLFYYFLTQIIFKLFKKNEK